MDDVATLTFLGSSAAVPSVGHDNVFLAVEGSQSVLLIDCGGSPALKLQLAGIDPMHLDYVLFTHRHPDHMYGFPILMLDLWLLGRGRPLHVVGEAESVRTAQALLAIFHSEDWPGFVQPRYNEVPLTPEAVALDLPDLLVTASPGEHLVPSLAFKVLNKATGQVVVYSSDTAPCSSVVRLARGADVLIHEASGDSEGHSSPAQAGTVAQEAGVGKLYLVHYPVIDIDLNAWLEAAQQTFDGPVELARDYGVIEF
jgi:ribonuclease Z